MKAIVFDDFGSADVLRLADVPMPEVRPDDLLVKVMAAGVNRADLLQREGVYGSQRYGDSDILGLEVAGEVISIGNAVTRFAVGDRVMGSSVVAHMLNMPASTAAWRWSFRPACRSRRQLPSWRAS
ncbi:MULTISPECIES: alcohol dehydrogenase catalytic domain-containing protein [unclassified Rhizobium]|uniref:alcohol dehydrogenase catalytic domain-containing protein n=1 Tax=Rhizobium TaxID=379 RepID=UPI00084C7608|nr:MULTISPECIES: alcohol dehydrogenase catalytic domain-containing protein [unclassified Rhizobium]OEC93868.1 hypothetical protein A9Z06_33865 [Rhizobium sp. YK2]QYA15971.1 alcohol dehydrogenase catalytic domain-containing protein [Rhizobium sp. AB2/73]UEQ84514.1 alcohol dehydrogenase catalytic domain-containing protein [Rhizobium sp. AB2/73]